MATETMKGTLRAIAVSITMSAVALFLDALFWRVVFLLGEVFTHLGATLRACGSVGRGPPVEPQPGSSGQVEGKKAGDADGPHSCSQSGTSKAQIDEGSGQAFHGLHRRAERVKDDETGPCHIHEGHSHGSESIYRQRPEWVKEEVTAPSPISSHYPEANVFNHYSEGNVPTFLCNVSCHRRWKKWYAVVLGWQPGLYNCWDCVEPKLRKFSGKKDKAFRLRRDAENFLRTEWHCLENH